MNITLWILQVLLGAFFLMSGFGKAFTPWEQLQHIPWINALTPGLVVFIGWSEMLGATGMILPAAIRFKPFVTPLAAAGLCLIMLLATGFHTLRGEYEGTAITLVLALLAGFVAYGRRALKPVMPRANDTPRT